MPSLLRGQAVISRPLTGMSERTGSATPSTPAARRLRGRVASQETKSTRAFHLGRTRSRNRAAAQARLGLAQGTSTSFPTDADCSSSSCARRASVSGRRSATTGWILSLTEQLEQCEEVLPEPLRVAGTSTHGKRSATSHGKHLVALAQLLDPVGEHPPAGREQAPERDGRGRRVPLDPPSPALAPVRERGIVAEHDKPSAGPQRAEGAKRQRAAEPVEHDVHAVRR